MLPPKPGVRQWRCAAQDFAKIYSNVMEHGIAFGDVSCSIVVWDLLFQVRILFHFESNQAITCKHILKTFTNQCKIYICICARTCVTEQPNIQYTTLTLQVRTKAHLSFILRLMEQHRCYESPDHS